MSWSLNVVNVPKAEARASFKAAHEVQYAYKNDGAHKIVMDQIAEFAGAVADTAPDGVVVSLSSSGHINSDGTGSCSVGVSISKPVAG